MAIRIPIISDFDSKGLDKAVKQFEQLKTSGEKAQFALEKAALPAGLALAALGASAVVATKAAIDDAAAQEQLAGVLERQTGQRRHKLSKPKNLLVGCRGRQRLPTTSYARRCRRWSMRPVICRARNSC